MNPIVGLMLAGLAVVLALPGCDSCNAPSSVESVNRAVVKTGGSTSVDKVVLALKQQFETDHPGLKIEYEANGSGDGITNTKSGLYEIGHSSRELKADETGIVAISYAIDGVAVVVNKENPVESLTRNQLRDIYTGRIKNWNQVGGRNSMISVITRESGSGTRNCFSEVVGLEKKGDPSTDIKASEETTSTGAVQTKVRTNPDAIGYMSFSDADASKVKLIGYDGVTSSASTLQDGSYKLRREFYLLTKEGATLSASAQAFLDFVQSDAGKKIIESKSLLVPRK